MKVIINCFQFEGSKQSGGLKDQPDLARKKCISDESGYFEGPEEFLQSESGSIEILFEKNAVVNNNLLKPRIAAPSPANSIVNLGDVTIEVSTAAANRLQPELPPGTSNGKSTLQKTYCTECVTVLNKRSHRDYFRDTFDHI